MANTYAHCLRHLRLIAPLPPPHCIRLRPNWPILLPQKDVGVEFIRVHRPLVVVFDTCPGHGMVAADWYLRQDIVFLDASEDVVWGDLGGCGDVGGRSAEGVEDVFAGARGDEGVEPCRVGAV